MSYFPIREIDRFVARDQEGQEVTILVMGHFKREPDAAGKFVESIERTDATTLGGVRCTKIDDDTFSFFDPWADRLRTLHRVR